MATWLCHLQIAKSLLRDHPTIAVVDLLTGSIAPDCGLLDAASQKFVPAKQVSHFQISAGPISANRPHNCNEEFFWNSHLGPVSSAIEDEQISFLLGYFTHLVVDNLWAHVVGIPTKVQFINDSADQAEAWRLVKSDWYDADVVRISRNNPPPVWAEFMCLQAPKSHIHVMPTENIRAQLPMIVSRYSQPVRMVGDHEPEFFPYFTPTQADTFVRIGSEILRRIVQEQLSPSPTRRHDVVSLIHDHEFSDARDALWSVNNG